MFTLKYLQKMIAITAIFKSIQIIYLLAIGFIFTIDQYMQQTYNYIDDDISSQDDVESNIISVKSVGVTYIMISIISAFNTCMGLCGGHLHNKFLLMIYFTVDIILFVIEISLGISLKNSWTPKFSKALRMDCMRTEPVKTSKDKCKEYWNHPKTKRFMNIWKNYFSQATSTENNEKSSDYYKRIIDVQSKGQCCGFYPPLLCMATISQMEIDQASQKKNKFELLLLDESQNQNKCGFLEKYYWYPHDLAEFCPTQVKIHPRIMNTTFMMSDKDYMMNIEDNQITIGCPYHLPLGNCKIDTINSETLGCAAIFEDQINDELFVTVDIAIFLGHFRVLSMIFACCLFWKRKREDVLPNLRNFQLHERLHHL